MIQTGNPVSGTYIFNPPAGTLLSAGTHTLTVTFTPTYTTNYTSGGTVQNSITVAQATPKIVLTPTQQIQQMTAFIQGINHFW
jgi:hypothetical protein